MVVKWKLIEYYSKKPVIKFKDFTSVKLINLQKLEIFDSIFKLDISLSRQNKQFQQIFHGYHD